MPAHNEVQQTQPNHHYMLSNQSHAYYKAVHSSPVHGVGNSMEIGRFSSNVDNVTNHVDTPILRALLNNKNIERSSPTYNHSPPAKRLCSQVSLDSGAISPVRTEDSLDYFDDFAFEKHPITAKNGFEYAPSMPSGMTGENLIAASSVAVSPLANRIVSSPITNYVESISTPPQSPNEAAIEHVNQMSNGSCDASSGTENGLWNQNGSDCKYFDAYTSTVPFSTTWVQ